MSGTDKITPSITATTTFIAENFAELKTKFAEVKTKLLVPIYDWTFGLLSEIFSEKIRYDTPMKIICNNGYLFLLSSILHIIILAVILFKLNIFKVNTSYPELTVIMFSLFILSKIIFSLYIYSNKRCGTGENTQTGAEVPSNTLVTKFFIYESIALTFGFIILTFVVGAIILGLKYASNNDIGMFVLLIAIFIASISILVIMSLLIYKYYMSAKNKEKVFLFLRTIFDYIPCLMTDMKEVIKSSLSDVTIVSVGVIFMVTAYLALTPLYNVISSKINEKYLFNGPVYISKNTNVNVPPKYDNTDGSSSSYSISFWFWITPQPIGTSSAYSKYTNILTYVGKPLVEYNTELDTLRVSSLGDKREDDPMVYSTKNIPKQKWNQFVMNYDAGTMDIFINGELVTSKNQMVLGSRVGNISIGETNGIEGGVRNVDYSETLLNARGIKMSYFINSLLFKLEN